MHFQIRDDILNLRSDKYKDNKGFCEDLSEGKFSFPIIHSIRHSPFNSALLNILKQRADDVDVKQYAVSLMEKTGSFKYSFEYLAGVEKMARSEITRLGGNPLLERILEFLQADGSAHEYPKRPGPI